MKFAWIEGGKIRDICQGGAPADHYHPDVAAFYTTEVPDEAANGDGWVNGQVIKPVVPEPVAQPKSWKIADIRKGLTLSERVKWDNDKSDEIKTAKIELDGVNHRAKVQEILDMLIGTGDISQESADVILAQTDNDGQIPVTVT